MKVTRERLLDRNGRPLVPGTKVKVTGETGQPEGTVVRVLDDYAVLTVVIPEGRGQVERMYRVADVEAI
ncbi:MAG: hypothetical protein QN141_07605 [Armatimonadota bacterium]|nr:hypothetical protein [Armatimonadota bacterium]MDR7450276.1 hypothetical protein [Armatimonadota bacterium]MDR7467141.1 hypothetical protein [Armatimonadota bacterium]MDR7493317.1 hypothetical protein [Armatimonadota bacterium]MDR7499325.1 hypothetical protein [Armatimonadota bacterium]